MMSDDDILRNLTGGVRVQVDPKAVSTRSLADVVRSFEMWNRRFVSQ
jgi:hypothetical protein